MRYKTRSLKPYRILAFVLLCACGPMLQRATGQPGRIVGPLLVERDSIGGYHCLKFTWEDLRAPASGINPAGAPVPPDLSATDGTLLFPANKNAVISVLFQFPHDFRQNADSVRIHLHWAKTTTDTGFVRWQMKYMWVNIGDAPGEYTAYLNGHELMGIASAAGGSIKHQMFQWTPVSAAGKTLSSFLNLVIQRQSSGAPDDTYPADAALYGVDVHYQRCIFSSNGVATGGQ